MKKFQEYIRRVEPYTPGEQPQASNLIKLNTNENPYPPSPKAVEALKEMDMDRLRLYPDPQATVLTSALADYYGVDKEQVFVGVGSDDVLGMAFLTFFNSDLPILFPDITYSFYDVWANLYRIPFACPALDENFRINPEDYKRPNGGVVITNPNAPTGICEPLSFIEKILSYNEDSLVIVDEAYIDFGGESALSLVNRYDNLLVVQTFSKSRSMAGMRIGFAIGNKELIRAMNDVKFSYNSYTMNQTSLAVGKASILDNAYFEECCRKIIHTREHTKEELEKLGFSCTDSATNFLFATHRDIPAETIFEALKAKNIFVRYFKKPRIDNYLRITIGTDEEMEVLLRELKQIIVHK
ncbi:MAG: histidinol-phosphate transaminase [Lachnospiraceae bacterium]|nr:histidinol-phosphate transaminase [Lachnospiraceae bacterium]